MNRFILIEVCNYKDFPLGGHLSFAKHLIKALGNRVALVGVTTEEDETPVGIWTKKEIEGVNFDYFSVKKVSRVTGKSLIPTRIKNFIWTRRYREKILNFPINNLIIQTPEVYFNFYNFRKSNIALVLPGLGNPLTISRYSYGKYFADFYERIFYRSIDKSKVLFAAADNESIHDFIRRGRGMFDHSKLIQFPTRFDDSIFSPKSKAHSREICGFNSKSILIVTSGRLNFFKGWKLLIDSFVLFKERNPDAYFVFLGDGEDRTKIESYIKEKNSEGSILLRGLVDHSTLSNYLNASDLFVMGSFAEGWSTSLVEAVACAKPICTTNFSSASELVVNGINGFVVNDRDESVFSSKMQDALKLESSGVVEKSLQIKKYSVSNLENDFLSSWNKFS